MMATYSAFFSSGFLAAPQVQIPVQPIAPMHDPSMLSPKDTYGSYFNFETSPVRASPMPLPDDSDIEVDDDDDGDRNRNKDIRRSVTPTPGNSNGTYSNPTTFPSSSSKSSTTSMNTGPKLRKRRSSLTIGTSALSAIRSPARTAANAGAAAAAVLRARSGSVGTISVSPDVFSSTVASEGTSLVGRMRSGSVGAAFRSRRPMRRVATAAPAPPPTVPLPALPSPTEHLVPGRFDDAPRSAPLCGTFHVNVNVAGARAVYEKKGRERAMSGTVAMSIEEIKEN